MQWSVLVSLPISDKEPNLLPFVNRNTASPRGNRKGPSLVEALVSPNLEPSWQSSLLTGQIQSHMTPLLSCYNEIPHILIMVKNTESIMTYCLQCNKGLHKRRRISMSALPTLLSRSSPQDREMGRRPGSNSTIFDWIP